MQINRLFDFTEQKHNTTNFCQDEVTQDGFSAACRDSDYRSMVYRLSDVQ